MIASGAGGGGGGAQLTPEQARLENPAPGSFQSGLGVLSGWVCAADTVEVVFEPEGTDETLIFEAGYGTARADTVGQCGDSDNGFGLLFNWNLLGDGQHTVRAYADGEAFAHSTFNVTTLGEEFAENLAQTHEIEDFPAPGQTTTVEWQAGQQNFVVTGMEWRPHQRSVGCCTVEAVQFEESERSRSPHPLCCHLHQAELVLRRRRGGAWLTGARPPPVRSSG